MLTKLPNPYDLCVSNPISYLLVEAFSVIVKTSRSFVESTILKAGCACGGYFKDIFFQSQRR